MSGGTGGTDHPAEPRGGETSGGSPQGRRPPLIGFFGSLVSQPKLFWFLGFSALVVLDFWFLGFSA
jgi:hypothetical protein